jgi:hypothetical protein
LGPINHAFSLATGTKSARISVFYFDGKGIKVGYTTSDKVVQEKVTGISPSEYYVFTLEWTEQELIWKINNLEVFRVKNDIPSEKMHLALNSFISENQKENNGTLQVEWVRAYQKVG